MLNYESGNPKRCKGYLCGVVPWGWGGLQPSCSLITGGRSPGSPVPPLHGRWLSLPVGRLVL